MVLGPNPKVPAGFTIPPLGLRSSATSDIAPASASSQLSEGEDHVGVVVEAEVFTAGRAVQMREVTVGARGLKAVSGRGAFFAGTLHSLGGFLDSGFPNPDLLLTIAIPDDVRADSPIVVFEGGDEDCVVHVVVAGEGGGEPDWHLFEGEIGFGIISGGEEVSAVDGNPRPCVPSA
jgi:hypothetical protein